MGTIAFTRICFATDKRIVISSVRSPLGKIRPTTFVPIVLERAALEPYSLDEDHQAKIAIAIPAPAKCVQNANQLIARLFNEKYASITSRNSAPVRHIA